MIPEDELKVFASLTKVKTVFDIGARDDVDYLILKPGITLHAFEPNPLFFAQLVENVGTTPRVYLNNLGAGDVTGRFEYNEGMQCIGQPATIGVDVIRLDNYIKKHRIKRIDFLKIDTEGYEPNVLRGLGEKVKICRYIQYEKDNGDKDIESEKILKRNGFKTYYTGYRNQIAVRDGEPMPWIPEEPQEGGVGEKSEANYLKYE